MCGDSIRPHHFNVPAGLTIPRRSILCGSGFPVVRLPAWNALTEAFDVHEDEAAGGGGRAGGSRGGRTLQGRGADAVADLERLAGCSRARGLLFGLLPGRPNPGHGRSRGVDQALGPREQPGAGHVARASPAGERPGLLTRRPMAGVRDRRRPRGRGDRVGYRHRKVPRPVDRHIGCNPFDGVFERRPNPGGGLRGRSGRALGSQYRQAAFDPSAR